MNHYITGSAIRALREQQHLTQAQLAEKLSVSDKTISKWETSRGLPDISLLEPLAQALKVSVAELLTGEQIINTNRAANMLKSQLYVCPICGNVFQSMGPAMVSCCGITLPPLEPETPDDAHAATIEHIEDEYYISVDHPMTKDHYISFIAYCTGSRFESVKLYPEGNAEARFFHRGSNRRDARLVLVIAYERAAGCVVHRRRAHAVHGAKRAVQPLDAGRAVDIADFQGNFFHCGHLAQYVRYGRRRPPYPLI